ncbi:hypothetical protein LTR85_004088 [Meristemomyces frigidus]|nr:hypothetical protein LTR85_004088 [Meristemomyces frigidus]
MAPSKKTKTTTASSSSSIAIAALRQNGMKLRFKPIEGVEYAKAFALAMISRYPSGQQKDRLLAERVLNGEGGDLVFSKRYARKPDGWNGDGAEHRRAAPTHILEIDAASCSVAGCHTAQPEGQDGLPLLGPFFTTIVQKSVSVPNVRPKDVSNAIRHALIDQPDRNVQADWQWVKHYKTLLENELRARNLPVDVAE